MAEQRGAGREITSRRAVVSVAHNGLPRAATSPIRADVTALTAYTTTIGTTSHRSYLSASVWAGRAALDRSGVVAVAEIQQRQMGQRRGVETGQALDHRQRRLEQCASLRGDRPAWHSAAPFITVAAPHHGFVRRSPRCRTTSA